VAIAGKAAIAIFPMVAKALLPAVLTGGISSVILSQRIKRSMMDIIGEMQDVNEEVLWRLQDAFFERLRQGGGDDYPPWTPGPPTEEEGEREEESEETEEVDTEAEAEETVITVDSSELQSELDALNRELVAMRTNISDFTRSVAALPLLWQGASSVTVPKGGGGSGPVDQVPKTCIPIVMKALTGEEVDIPEECMPLYNRIKVKAKPQVSNKQFRRKPNNGLGSGDIGPS
jgi:hypothetical protein